MNTYWNIIAIALTLLSVLVAFNMDMNNPIALLSVAVVFGSAMFLFGYSFDAAKKKIGTAVDERLANAATKAVNTEMAKIPCATDDDVDALFRDASDDGK